jgi:hypothetical protein
MFITKRKQMVCGRKIINDNQYTLQQKGTIEYFPFCTMHYKQKTKYENNIQVILTDVLFEPETRVCKLH